MMKNWLQFINENKNTIGIQLGDKVIRNGKNYRVVGLNPVLKLQEILIVNGWEELGNIDVFDWSISDSLHKQKGSDWIWIGDF
jgi:hypothetical protein